MVILFIIILLGTIMFYATLSFMPNICCVDDNQQSCLLVDTILTESGYSVSTYQSPIEFLRAFQSNHYDLIIMDVCMPEMSGIDCLKKIRDFSNNLPVIAMTALALKEELIEIENAQFLDVIIKPINILDFIERIQRLCPN